MGTPLVPLDRELLSSLMVFCQLAPILQLKRVASSSLLSLSVGDLQELEQQHLQLSGESLPLARSGGGGGGGGGSGSSWACDACTYVNTLHSDGCEVCGTPRAKRQRSQSPPSKKPTTASTEQQQQQQRQSARSESGESDDGAELALLQAADNANAMFHQLRSRALKVLCVYLGDRRASQFIVAEHAFFSILKLSILQTHLREWQSLERLEQREARLHELLYDLQHAVGDESRQLARRALKAGRLPHSPFGNLGIALPTRLDGRCGRNVRVRGAASTCAVARLPLPGAVDDGGVPGSDGAAAAHDLPPELQGFASVALCRANYAIPQSVPAFYFEVLVEADGNEADEAGSGSGARVAVGLYRDGLPLEGVPGHNSYAYGGDAAALYHTRDGELQIAELGPKTGYGVGDVVGCALDTRHGSLYFTLNGTPLGTPLTGLRGRFYPCVWLMKDKARVRVNFGQRPFRFDFVSTLGADYLINLEHDKAKASKLTQAEIQRRTRAENLLTMFPHYPLDLCVLALERCRDDLSHAASWLIENGNQELERMAVETMEQTAKTEARRQEQWMQSLL